MLLHHSCFRPHHHILLHQCCNSQVAPTAGRQQPTPVLGSNTRIILCQMSASAFVARAPAARRALQSTALSHAKRTTPLAARRAAAWAATPRLSRRNDGPRGLVKPGRCSLTVRGDAGWISVQADPAGNWRSSGKNPLPSNLDGIVVLAGGQIQGGSGLPQNVEPRLDAAVALYEAQDSPCPVLCTGGGTPHKPPILDANGYVYFESNNMADYLTNKGFPATSILKEVSSFDTIGNGYYALTIHSIPRGWRNVAMITSEFHMPRSKAIFEHCYGLAGDALGMRFNLHFVAVPDIGMPEDVLEARREREAKSLKNFMGTVEATPSLAKFSEWMHMEHMCYAVPRQGEFGKRTISDDKALASY